VTTWKSFVAIGDSFTEGVGDPLPEGTFRGWADLVAGSLAERSPGLRYANLAVRGRTFDGVVEEQVAVAVRMRPDLIAFAAGGNDALRRGFDVAELMRRFDEVVGWVRTGSISTRWATSGLPRRCWPPSTWPRLLRRCRHRFGCPGPPPARPICAGPGPTSAHGCIAG
jgi:lysophospholipase L1-like esterase